MFNHIRPAIVLLLGFTLLTGIAYPLAITGIAGALFPHQAGGSLIKQGGKVIGSELIGQSFTSAKYFWGRPSAAGKDGYDAMASGGSNLGPSSKALADRVKGDIAKLRQGQSGPVPTDLATASGSGLDPDISPAAARYQMARVAAARHFDLTILEKLIADHTEPPFLGIFGKPRVNVLQLNLALDALKQ